MTLKAVRDGTGEDRRADRAALLGRGTDRGRACQYATCAPPRLEIRPRRLAILRPLRLYPGARLSEARRLAFGAPISRASRRPHLAGARCGAGALARAESAQVVSRVRSSG